MSSSIPIFFHFAAILVMMAIGTDGLVNENSYDFFVTKKPKNVSCFECNNFTFNTTEDRQKFAVLNHYCEKDPGRIKHFIKKCPSTSVGCGFTKTYQIQYSTNPAQREVFFVKRFCADALLPKCDVSEGSRGDITICTCTSDFCNSAMGVKVGMLSLLSSILVILMQSRS